MGVVVIVSVWFSNLQDSMNRDNNKTPFRKYVLPFLELGQRYLKRLY